EGGGGKGGADTPRRGANATVTSRMLDGMWVNTIVLTRPIRLASHAAPRCEIAFRIRAPKNSAATSPSDAPNRSKKKYDSIAVVRNPPARLSIANSDEIRRTIARLCGDSLARRPGRAASSP